MSQMLRIAVADDEPRMRDFLWTSLQRLGHSVVAAARTGRELADDCRRLKPDLVITDIKMCDMDGIDAAAEIYRDESIPVIVVSAFHDEELIERAKRQQIAAYLVKPIKHSDLAPAIELAMERFHQFEALRREAADLKQALEDRKLIERAKGIVMVRTGMSEPDAFRRLQRLASGKSVKLAELARMIVTAEEAAQPEEG